MMKRLGHIIAFAGLLILGNSASAQDAAARIDRTEILIGEQAVLSLSYRVDKSNIPLVVFPDIGSTLVEGIEVLKKTGIDTLKTGDGVGETHLEQKIFITSFDSGSYTIPAYKLVSNGQMQETNPIHFSVQTVAIDTTKGIFGNRDGYEVEVSWTDYVKAFFKNKTVRIVGLGLAILLMLGLAIRYFKKRRNQKTPVEIEAPAPPIPPFEWAVMQLEEMLSEKHYATENVKVLHTKITDVLRTYLEQVYQVHAPEQTSSQILNELRYSGIEEKWMLALRKILFRADMVKFAKERPDVRENQAAIEDALAFVKAHEPLPSEPQNESEAGDE